MNLTKEFRWTISSLPVTGIAIIVCVFLMGGGHGTYTPTIILFPYAMLIAIADREISQSSMILGLIQFTTYGLILDLIRGTKRKLLIVTILLLLHGLVVYEIMNKGETF